MSYPKRIELERERNRAIEDRRKKRKLRKCRGPKNLSAVPQDPCYPTYAVENLGECCGNCNRPLVDRDEMRRQGIFARLKGLFVAVRPHTPSTCPGKRAMVEDIRRATVGKAGLLLDEEETATLDKSAAGQTLTTTEVQTLGRLWEKATGRKPYPQEDRRKTPRQRSGRLKTASTRCRSSSREPTSRSRTSRPSLPR